MINTAVCFFGTSVSPDLYNFMVSKCIDKFKNHRLTFFSGIADDITKALFISSFNKNDHEVTNNEQFDLCIAIDLSRADLIEHITIPEKIEDIFYYVSGWSNPTIRLTGVEMSAFFAKSQIFNRACEFYQHKDRAKYCEDAFTRDRYLPIQESFFYHLKVINLPTTCINHENSNLFKRAA